MEKVRSSAMAGQGEYDRNARVQSTAAGFALACLERAAACADLPAAPAPIVVADWGSSTGKNSLGPMGMAVASLRARSDAPILVAHVDQSTNDFSTLFSTLETNPQSYLQAHPQVFGCAVGRSFYEAVLPPASVSVGWSAAAAHWLSRVPAPLEDHLWAPTARAHEAEPFAAQARQDWRLFLQRRAVELRPGGEMVVVVATVDDEGICGGEHVLDALDRGVKRLIGEGALSRDEYRRMVVPNFFLSREELEAPLADPELGGALALLEHARITAPDPLWTAFQSSGDATAFARAFVGWIRAFSEPCLFGALDEARPADERRALADRAYAAAAAEITAQPEAARCAWRMAALHLRRR